MDEGTKGCLKAIAVIVCLLVGFGVCVRIYSDSNTITTNDSNAPAWVRGENPLVSAAATPEDAISATFDSAEFRFEWKEAETGAYHSSSIQLSKVHTITVPEGSGDAWTIQFQWMDGGQVAGGNDWSKVDPGALAIGVTVRLTEQQKRKVPFLVGR
jgi:hypothetical protein